MAEADETLKEELEDEVKLLLRVAYPDSYPDVPPDLTIDTTEGELSEDELRSLHDQLKAAQDENIGMAMTFTLISLLREKLFEVVRTRLERQKETEAEEERRLLEEEEAKTKGTPVTVEAFTAWKSKFDKEMAARRNGDEEEKLKGLTPKERDEAKKLHLRFTGKQLFEKNHNLEDETLVEEGDISVDTSQYERTRQQDEEEEQERLEFSDSD